MLSCSIIGLGRIGLEFEFDPLMAKPASHVGAVNAVGGIYFKAAVDIDAGRLKKAAEHADFGGGFRSSFKSVDDYLTSSEQPSDIVTVATPAETHRKIVENVVVEKPPKLIFCEKPLATTLEDAVEMVRVCDEKKIHLVVNHSRRWSKTWRRTHSLGRELGDLKLFMGYYSGDPMNVGVHMQDLVNWFKPDETHLFNINYPRLNGYLAFDVDLWFEAGRIQVLNNGMQILTCNVKSSERFSDTWELQPSQPITVTDVSTPILTAYREIISFLEHGYPPLSCTGLDGVEAMRTMTDRECC